MADNLYDPNKPTVLIVEDSGAERSSMFLRIKTLKDIGKIDVGNVFAPISFSELESTIQTVKENNPSQIILLLDHDLGGYGCEFCNGRTIGENLANYFEEVPVFKIGISDDPNNQMHEDRYVHYYLGKSFTTKGLEPALKEANTFFENFGSESNELNSPK